MDQTSRRAGPVRPRDAWTVQWVITLFVAGLWFVWEMIRRAPGVREVLDPFNIQNRIDQGRDDERPTEPRG